MKHGPEAHYDRVTAAWSLLLGEEMHFGVFRNRSDDLPTATRALTDLMRDSARIEEENEVLDVGCGIGAPACYLARTRGARVTGISISEVGIRASRDRAVNEGVAELASFEKRNGMSNGFDDHSFDRVWVLESSHLMRDKAHLIAECARVLRPDGRFALCDLMVRDEINPYFLKPLGEAIKLLRKVFAYARMAPVDQYRLLAHANGLELEEPLDLTDSVQPTFAHWRANADRHRDAVIALFGDDGLRELEEFVEASHLMEGLWADGVLGYMLLSGPRVASAPPGA
jgi:27-O-demethylrifamycin SV methyltransferase